MVGCTDSTTGDGSGVGDRDSSLVAAGADLYAANCAVCHGADLRGTESGPSHLSVVYEPSHHSDAAFMLAARRGVAAHHWSFGPMPPIEGVSDSDLEAIVAFVRDAQEREGFEPYTP
jgi:mono/diheme cytochrome c family protein